MTYECTAGDIEQVFEFSGARAGAFCQDAEKKLLHVGDLRCRVQMYVVVLR